MLLSILRLCPSLLLTASILPVSAQDSQSGVALGALPEVGFSQLSQRDPNLLCEKALAIHPDQWKHAETEHFIYHFVHSYVAAPVSVEAEFHASWPRSSSANSRPAIRSRTSTFSSGGKNGSSFKRSANWNRGRAESIRRAVSSSSAIQRSLFIQRNPVSSNPLGHEIVHLVMHRFYSGGIPCWLDEGFAQYISKAAHASYQRARGYIAKPHSSAIASQDLIPLISLFAITYPPSDRVATFYNESERLVRFLAETDRPSFLALLDALARHQPFEAVFARTCVGKFASTRDLEEKFRDYAAKDFGTTLQQADND